jgi:hypothetical protein
MIPPSITTGSMHDADVVPSHVRHRIAYLQKFVADAGYPPWARGTEVPLGTRTSVAVACRIRIREIEECMSIAPDPGTTKLLQDERTLTILVLDAMSEKHFPH